MDMQSPCGVATWLTAVERGHCPIKKKKKFEFGQKKFCKKSRNGEQRSRRRNKVKGPPWFDGPLSFAYSVLVIVRRVPFYNSGMDRPDPAKNPQHKCQFVFFTFFY
jgi:hypothetical protein